MDNMKDMILEAVEMNGIENVVMPLMNEIFLSLTDIAGTRYVDNQDVFKRLEKNDPLLLEREADNEYDSNAIKVLTTKQHQVQVNPLLIEGFLLMHSYQYGHIQAFYS